MARHHDELLEEIRQPLLDRVDRRLAAILAISIAIHLGVAIVAWLGDPPAMISFGDQHPRAAVIDANQILDVAPVIPAPTSEPGPGVAPPAVPAPAPATAVRRGRTRLATPPGPIDAQKLVADAFSDDGITGLESRRRQPGRDLEDELARARAIDDRARVGRPGGNGDSVFRVRDGQEPVIDGPTGVVGTRKRAEHAPPPRIIRDPPPTGVDFDPSREIRARYLVGLQRCYQRELVHFPGLQGRVDLAFTIAPDGSVTRADARGLDDVAVCVAGLARRWTFDVGDRLKDPTGFKLGLIFVAH